MFGFEHHRPTTISPEMSKAIITISKALTTDEQRKALFYLERELGMASAYITELQWDAEEAAALIGNYLYYPDWAFSTDYLHGWAEDCYKRLLVHRETRLSCMVEKPAEKVEWPPLG